MKKNFYIIAAIALLTVGTVTSCSKEQVQQKVEDLATKIMTDGTWIVTKFVQGGTDITTDFSGWECQFYSNSTCEGRKGTTKIAGTWSASTSSQTITGMFPVGSTPIDKVNGTWKIVRSNYTFGEFSQTKNGMAYTMELTKK